MSFTDDVAQAVRSRDAGAIHALLFERPGRYDPAADRTRGQKSIP